MSSQKEEPESGAAGLSTEEDNDKIAQENGKEACEIADDSTDESSDEDDTDSSTSDSCEDEDIYADCEGQGNDVEEDIKDVDEQAEQEGVQAAAGVGELDKDDEEGAEQDEGSEDDGSVPDLVSASSSEESWDHSSFSEVSEEMDDEDDEEEDDDEEEEEEEDDDDDDDDDGGVRRRFFCHQCGDEVDVYYRKPDGTIYDPEIETFPAATNGVGEGEEDEDERTAAEVWRSVSAAYRTRFSSSTQVYDAVQAEYRRNFGWSQVEDATIDDYDGLHELGFRLQHMHECQGRETFGLVLHGEREVCLHGSIRFPLSQEGERWKHYRTVGTDQDADKGKVAAESPAEGAAAAAAAAATPAPTSSTTSASDYESSWPKRAFDELVEPLICANEREGRPTFGISFESTSSIYLWGAMGVGGSTIAEEERWKHYSSGAVKSVEGGGGQGAGVTESENVKAAAKVAAEDDGVSFGVQSADSVASGEAMDVGESFKTAAKSDGGDCDNDATGGATTSAEGEGANQDGDDAVEATRGPFCSRCDCGFVEEMVADSESENSGDGGGGSGSGGGRDRQAFASGGVVGDGDFDGRDLGVDENLFEFLARGLRAGTAAQRSGAGAAAAAGQREAAPFTAPRGMPAGLAELLMNMLGGVRGQGLHGNAGDYVHDPRTLELLMQSFLNQDEHAGPPPTSEEALKKLKQSKGKLSDVLRDVKAKQKKQAGSAGDGGKDGAGAGLKDADKLTCVVCREEFDEDGTDVVPLPCGHVFHEGCILPWLETNNTCPVCRFELPAAGGGGSGGGGTAATDAGNGGSGNGGSGGGGGGGGGTQNDNGEGSASGEGGGNSWFW